MAAGLAGAAQLVLEFATAVWALVLAIRLHDDGGRLTDRPAVARRSRFGRLAVLASVVFLLLTIRLPAWSTYLEILTQSQWIRDFILRDDFTRVRTLRPSPSPESAWVSDARGLFRAGEQAWREGKYSVSADNYSRLAALLDTVPAKMSRGEHRLAAECLNNWAWLLATCPEKGLRNYADAVRYARRALELEPKDGNTWNTLGVAYYRLEAWDDALNALYRSMELRDEGDSADWFFLAMIHQRLGRKERAREWYDKAAHWSHRYRPGDEELYRFEVEAAETLGLPKPEWRPSPPAQIERDPRYSQPYSLPSPRGLRMRGPLQPVDGRPRPR
jgi:tetratricopeptide (TPR) repeat protein